MVAAFRYVGSFWALRNMRIAVRQWLSLRSSGVIVAKKREASLNVAIFLPSVSVRVNASGNVLASKTFSFAR